MARVLGGVIFATGLVLVVLTGAELLTSSTLTPGSRQQTHHLRPAPAQLAVVYVAKFWAR